MTLRIDAHQHYWRYDPTEYGWIDDSLAPLRRDFMPEDARREMDGAGFDGAVAVQARQTLEETRFLLELADRHPFVVGVVGWVDLQSTEVRAQLQRFARHPKLVGIRHIAQSEPDDRFLLREDFCRGIARLQEFDLAYDLLVYPRQLPAAVELVHRFDAQRFVLDHLGKPEIRSGALRAWSHDLERLAQAPNVCAKLSGLVTEANWNDWTPDHIRPFLDVAFDCFGPERLLIGSDWPVCNVAADYGRTMSVVTGYLEARPDRERVAVLGGNARRFWKLAPEPEGGARP